MQENEKDENNEKDQEKSGRLLTPRGWSTSSTQQANR